MDDCFIRDYCSICAHQSVSYKSVQISDRGPAPPALNELHSGGLQLLYKTLHKILLQWKIVSLKIQEEPRFSGKLYKKFTEEFTKV